MCKESVAVADTATIHQYIKAGKDKMMTEPDSAIASGMITLRLSREIDYDAGIMTAYNIIGMSHWAKGEFNKGIEYMQLMIVAAKKYNDTSELATAYGNIAILYIDMGDRELGLQYSKRAIALYTSIGDEKNVVHYINNIGWIYEAEKKYDSAIVYYTTAIEGYKKHFTDVGWLGQAYANLSSVYYNMEQPVQSLQYARDGLAICARNADNHKAKGHAYLSMSKAYLLNKKYATTIKYADSALRIAQSKNINTLTAEAYYLKYKASELLGQYKDAIKYLELNRLWIDSLINEETDGKLAAIKTQLAVEKKDKELALKEKQLALSKVARQRNLFYLMMAIMVAAFASVTAYQVYKRQQLRINAKNRQLEIEQKQNELVALQLKNQELKNEELNKELLSFTLTTAQKNQLLQDINEELNNLPQDRAVQIRRVKHIVNAAIGNEEDWEEFKIRFEQVHRSFFETLKSAYPQLSNNDLRLCAFIKLNLNSKQIASLLNIAPSSVDISKYRLKKKLNLEKDDNLNDFIINT